MTVNEAQPFFQIDSDYRHPYFMQIEKSLLNGASIDKLGFQYHIFTGSTARTQEEYDQSILEDVWKTDPMLSIKSAEVFGSLGLPMEVTEVTFPTLGDTEEDEDLQAELLRNFYSVWFSIPQIETVVYWNTVDGYAYETPASDPNQGYWNENACRGGLFHHDLTPKKSALMLKKLFTECWHTDLDLTTDNGGYVEFKGFYGDYELAVDGRKSEFAIHKNEANIYIERI